MTTPDEKTALKSKKWLGWLIFLIATYLVTALAVIAWWVGGRGSAEPVMALVQAAIYWTGLTTAVMLGGQAAIDAFVRTAKAKAPIVAKPLAPPGEFDPNKP